MKSNKVISTVQTCLDFIYDANHLDKYRFFYNHSYRNIASLGNIMKILFFASRSS